jgi:sugar phosphate isomerase/epimerase
VKLSLSTACLYLYPLRWTFAIARAVGFEGVELVLNPEITPRGGRYVKTLIEEYDLPVLSLHPPMAFLPGRGDCSAHLPQMIEMALELGCPLVILHPPQARSFDDGLGRAYLEALEEGQRQAEGSGVRIGLENRGFFFKRDGSYLLSDSRELRRFADEHDLPLILDTAHAGSSARSLMETYEIMRERLANIHFSDLRPLPWLLDWPYLHTYLKHHQIPGRGHLPLAELLARLRKDGYCGPLTLEISPVALGAWWPWKARANLALCLDFVREER